MSTSRGPLPVRPREVSVRRCVPAGRPGRSLRGEWLFLYSVLAPAAYEELQGNGVVSAHPEIELFDRDAYDWLIGQMRHRRIPVVEGRYPIWFWAKIRRRDLLGEVRRTVREEPGSVLVTARVHRDRVLLNDYGAWHCVLNRSVCLCADFQYGEEEVERKFDAVWEDLTERFPGWRDLPLPEWPAELRREIEPSWQFIFDLDAAPGYATWQAVVGELRTDDVVSVVRPVLVT
jgi:hypothetical protein